MRQDVSANGAYEWQRSIADSGHVALYGIYFDQGKADLMPESDAADEGRAKNRRVELVKQ